MVRVGPMVEDFLTGRISSIDSSHFIQETKNSSPPQRRTRSAVEAAFNGTDTDQTDSNKMTILIINSFKMIHINEDEPKG